MGVKGAGVYGRSMDVVDAGRMFIGEALAVAGGLYGLSAAWQDGSVLFMGVSFALVGVSVALAGVRYNRATTT